MLRAPPGRRVGAHAPRRLEPLGEFPHRGAMSTRTRVGVVYGGRSGEHEVSLRSAAAVIRALDPARYEVVPIAITKEGRWLTGPDSLRLLEVAQTALEPIADQGTEVTLPADPTRSALIPLDGPGTVQALDVVFPVLHGTYGEDGTIQGLLELANIPYVGAGVLASAVGMDKALMKAVFRDAGIPVCRWLVTRCGEETPAALARRGRRARLPVLRQASEPRLLGRHQQGASGGAARRGGHRGRCVRSQDRHRGGDRRPGVRVRRARQRASGGVRDRRAGAVARVLRLRRQVRRPRGARHHSGLDPSRDGGRDAQHGAARLSRRRRLRALPRGLLS